MNTKKIIVAAMVAAIAVSSAVISVSALPAGWSESANIGTADVKPNEDTKVVTSVDNATIEATIPANAVTGVETVKLGAAAATDVDAEAALAQKPDIVDSKIIDLYFFDEDGEDIAPTYLAGTTKLVINTAEYDVVYTFSEDTGSLTKVATSDNGKIEFVYDGSSRYVLAKTKAEVSQVSDVSQVSQVSQQSQVSQTSQASQQTTNTGDSGATAGVFAVVGLASLGTALVASKSKKHAK